MKTTELFPFIPAEWTLFHDPEGGYLIHRGKDGVHLTGEVWCLTDLSVRIVLLCDGTRTIAQILKEIHDSCEGESFSAADSAARFLAEAVDKGFIKTQDTSGKRQLKEKGSRNKYYPLHFAIELTDACNLECRHCYRESGPRLAHRLPTGKLLSLLAEFYKNGVQSLELSGGEPTLHPDFVPILDYALSHFSSTAVLTNGTLLKEPIYNLLAKYKDKAIVQVDLDGCNANEHDQLRGVRGAFEKAKDAIQQLSRRNISVRVAMTMHKLNADSIEKTYQLAKKLGARWFSGSPVMDVGRARGNDLLLSWEQLKTAVEQLNALAYRDPATVMTAAEMKRLSGKLGSNCGAGSRSIALGPEGNLRPCFLVNKKLPTFKNIMNVSLDEALDEAPLGFFRNLEPPCPELCGDCSYTVFCYGCIARPLIAWDRMKEKDENFVCSWRLKTHFMENVFPEKTD